MNADAEDADAQAIKKELASGLDKYRLRRKQGYSSVHVLLLSWQVGDAAFAEDANEVAAVFQDSFNYSVLPYKIPTENSQIRLNLHVAHFVERFGGEDNLIVVYYGGHGGPSALNQSDCQWSAFRTDGPTLDWSVIQPQFLSADCDVVIFLDCCYAGQAVRTRISHRVEFLAATDKDQFTPIGKGEYPSFTKVLVREMKRMLEDHGVVTIPSLQRCMVGVKSGLRKQPFYVPLSEKDPQDPVNAVRLTRWERIDHLETYSVLPESPTERAFFELRLRLTHPIDRNGTKGLVNWVTKNSPHIIDDIEVVDKGISETRATINLAHQLGRSNYDGLPSHRPFLPDPAQQKINELLEDLNESILTSIPEAIGDIESIKVFNDIKEKSAKISNFINSCLTSLDGESCAILRKQDLSSIEDLRNQISMRLTLLDDDTDRNPIRVSFKSLAQSNQRIRIGQVEDRTVVVEYFSYDATTKDSYTKASRQVAKVSALLSEPKDSTFRTLPGVGFTHDTNHGPRFGMVYDLPENRDGLNFCFLSDVISKTKFVPLDIRCRLSLALCEAVMRLHSIGWFHKGIKSENVIFPCSPNAKDGQLCDSLQDLEQPFLIGFDCSRPEDAETWATVDFNTAANIYRHPDRWGRPSRFERHHDLYALGILLIEIGLWKVLPSMLRGGIRAVKDPEPIRNSIVEMTAPAGRLSHAVGADYASATRNCIESAGLRQYRDWEYHDIVRSKIRAPLRACCSAQRAD
ncbi:hypothetical protein F5X99DRAFT_406800 [Biscogniauxia marginata]|nr:hypothetical protein F5X99DRAFT_406800 [Biscogniauxia marginata]